MRSVLAAAAMLAGATAPVLAAGPDLLDAAVTLAEVAQARGDAALLAGAGETMRALAGDSPEGGNLARTWLAEARFLARGDPRLLARIGTIEAEAAGTGLIVVRVTDQPVGIRLPAAQGALLRSTDPTLSALPVPEQDGRKLRCAPARTGGLWCDPPEGTGPVVLTPAPGGAMAPYLVFHAAHPPADREARP